MVHLSTRDHLIQHVIGGRMGKITGGLGPDISGVRMKMEKIGRVQQKSMEGGGIFLADLRQRPLKEVESLDLRHFLLKALDDLRNRVQDPVVFVLP